MQKFVKQTDASFQQITFPEYTILQYNFSFIIIL